MERLSIYILSEVMLYLHSDDILKCRILNKGISNRTDRCLSLYLKVYERYIGDIQILSAKSSYKAVWLAKARKTIAKLTSTNLVSILGKHAQHNLIISILSSFSIRSPVLLEWSHARSVALSPDFLAKLDKVSIDFLSKGYYHLKIIRVVAGLKRRKAKYPKSTMGQLHRILLFYTSIIKAVPPTHLKSHEKRSCFVIWRLNNLLKQGH